MNIEIETYRAFPCRTETFRINGIDAFQSNFGSMEDTDIENAPKYGCGCMKFIPLDDRMSEAMWRYGITADEFYEVQSALESALYVGRCCWCILR